MSEFGCPDSTWHDEVQVPETIQKQILLAVRSGDLSLAEFADNKVLLSKSLLLPEVLIEAAKSTGWRISIDANGLVTLNPTSSIDAF